MADEWQELRVSNDALDDPPELRARMDTEGYVFLKRLFSPDDMLSLRRAMTEKLQEHGWLQAGTDPLDGIAVVEAQCTEGDVNYTDVYHEVYRLQEFHRSGHWPVILDAMGKIIDAPVLPHPMKIARIWFPQYTDHTTPAHQDFVHFQGTFDTYTCWAPVGDCPEELGGLAVVPGTHKVGEVVDHHFSLGAGSLVVDDKVQKGPWLSTNYEMGDALLFHSLTVHKALPNVTHDRMRISLDNRYQSIHEPIAEHMLTPHLSQEMAYDWDDVYANWSDDTLKYYWTGREQATVPRDMSYGERGFAEAVERATQGDPAARLHLERIIRRDPESENGRKAAAALQAAT